MKLYWLEQVQADVPLENDWLSPWEIARLDRFRFPKRRADWRLGRWTAKQALAAALNLGWDDPALASIEIRPAASGAPEVFVANECAPVAISLSHREGCALCAMAPRGARVGCDLEAIEARSAAFIDDYFTADERDLIAAFQGHGRELTVSLLWSAKESALKALHEGLRLDTRAVIASFDSESLNSDGWGLLEVRYGKQLFTGWWQDGEHLIRTILADAPSNPPIRLPVASLAENGFVPEFPTSVL